MPPFNGAKIVRLRSHHGIIADDNKESVSLDRIGSQENARWIVELITGSDDIIRLKSCFGKYLAASDERFRLGMTGRKVIQTASDGSPDSTIEWEAIREEGDKVKLKTPNNKYLRAWRNSVTHKVTLRRNTPDRILWEVDGVANAIFPSSPDEPNTDTPDQVQQEQRPPKPSQSNTSGKQPQRPSRPSKPKNSGAQVLDQIADGISIVDGGLGIEQKVNTYVNDYDDDEEDEDEDEEEDEDY